jgi:anti-repressor protein
MEQNQLAEAVQKEIARILADPAELRGLIIKQTELIEQMTPKAVFYDKVTSADSWHEMSAVAKVLNIEGLGRNKIFALLRDAGILRYNNEPYQEYVDRGCFKTVMREHSRGGESYVTYTTMVSAKGVAFINKVIQESL